MSENLKIYEKYKHPPQEALKTITGGKLNGMTDINPIWRIKSLTEEFGPCGKGWKTADEIFWTAPGANGEIAAFCRLNLYVKFGEEWSAPIFGIGGSMFVSTEKGNLRTNDECYKMAYTDAMSVACKALGFGGSVYWQKDRTKYTGPVPSQSSTDNKEKFVSDLHIEVLKKMISQSGRTDKYFVEWYEKQFKHRFEGWEHIKMTEFMKFKEVTEKGSKNGA